VAGLPETPERDGTLIAEPRLRKTTLVVLTHNRKTELLECVERALALPERPPIVVVDNASTDRSAAAVKEAFPHVKLVRTPFHMGAAARNLGAECADTAYVAFCDADSDWAPGSLRLAELILDMYPRIGALAARVRVGVEGFEDPASLRMSRSPLPSPGLPGPAVLEFLPNATIFRRRAFIEAGGYDPRFFVGGEEELLAYDLAALGWRLVYVASLTVHQYPSPRSALPQRERYRERNALWVAWLRRPIDVAMRRTIEHLSGKRDRRALLEAAREVFWAVANRRVLPPQVEAWCRLLEAQALEAGLADWGPAANAGARDFGPVRRREVS
jgi:GT2 family glycosyltransferase